VKVLYNWLREFVRTDLSPQEIAEGLTMAGIEVASVERVGSPSEGVKIGIITGIRPHPEADRLVVCNVNVGDGDLCIVTGDLSLRVHDRVAVAVPGAQLPRNKRIERTDFKGIRSEGMLCALTEILLGEPHRENEGVVVLKPSSTVRPGMALSEALEWDDYLIELDLTPNYVHCLSLAGVAREVAALNKGSHLTDLGEALWYTWHDREGKQAGLRVPSRPAGKCEEEARIEFPLPEANQVKVRIESPHLCNRYSAQVLSGIKVVPSDPLVQWRLVMVEQRPINSIVDATNYAMIETGQPLHAFDYDFIRDKTIVVRTANPKEEIRTLDGVVRKLDPDMLLITDGFQGDRPIAIAGVMGGQETEITDSTTTVLLESAFFAPDSVGLTSRRLRLKSEASVRFERGVDPLGTLLSIDRFCNVLKKTSDFDSALCVVDENPVPCTPISMNLSVSYVNRLLGTKINSRQIKGYLSSLGFEVRDSEMPVSKTTSPRDHEIIVLIPTRRVDIGGEVDLVEEVGRAAGLECIPTTLPVGAITVGTRPFIRRLIDKVKDVAVGSGLDEVITYSFIGDRCFDKMRLDESHPMRRAIRIANPIREEQSIMRTSLIPGLLEALSYNASRQVEDMGVFEIGKVFIPLSISISELPEERTSIAIAGMGHSGERAWNAPRLPWDFYHIKGVLERILWETGILTDHVELSLSDQPFLHPARQAKVVIKPADPTGEEGKEGQSEQGQIIECGVIGEIHPLVAEDYKLPGPVTICEIDLDKLLPHTDFIPKFKPVPKYPASIHDLALLLPNDVSAGTVLSRIREVRGTMLEDVRLFDVYSGDPIPEGKKSLAFSLTYRAQDRTLTDAEIREAESRILGVLAEEFGAQKRL
jgi:phenylalanyl-tRNA synthetase beta chain